MSPSPSATPPPLPTPPHHLIVQNPFALGADDDSDSLGSNDDHLSRTSASLSVPTLAPPALRPRHATFHVCLVLHQLANIPLVSGEFAVQWKFRHAQQPSRPKTGAGILSSFVKVRRNDTADPSVPTEELAVVQPKRHRHSPSSSSASTASSSASSTSSDSGPPLLSRSLSTSRTASSLSGTSHSTPARGQTPFHRLKDHNVSWEHTLSLLVRIDIDRAPHSNLLQPSPLKLLILSRDPSAPHQPPLRFGVVHLDLAQYALKGEISRRYLLRESKTNATLKLTTHLIYVPPLTVPGTGTPPTPTPTHSSLPAPVPAPAVAPLTPTTPCFGLPPSLSLSPCATSNSTFATTASNVPFSAPPLPPGEILAGISNLAATGLGVCTGEWDPHRTRPKGLDLYGPYFDAEEMEMDLLGGWGRGKEREEVREEEEEEKSSFDPSRLPLAYGAKTTEMLIDALFNPVETREKRRESPFTVYVGGVPAPVAVLPQPPKSEGTPNGKIVEQMALAPADEVEPTSVPTTLKRTETGVSVRTVRSHPVGTASGSTGIGAGLGIMGLGIGLGVGLGVGVGVVSPGAGTSEVDAGAAGTAAGSGIGRVPTVTFVGVEEREREREREREKEKAGEKEGGVVGGFRAWWARRGHAAHGGSVNGASGTTSADAGAAAAVQVSVQG